MPEPKLTFSLQGDNLNIDEGYNLPKYTILVGKNNSGKSRLVVAFYRKIPVNDQAHLPVFYISPERFGELSRSSSIEDENFTNRHGRDQQKLKNQSSDFITDALSSFNGLVAQINRPPVKRTTRLKILAALNNKINGIEFSYTTSDEHTGSNFLVNGRPPNPQTDMFSSGTNQIIALMTQVMYFVYSKRYAEDAYLLLDEPDVHIHPDLQIEFIKFVVDVTKATRHKVIIATHSSSIISGFSSEEDVYIATKKTDELIFSHLNNQIQQLLPALGSHSLSHAFNKAPLLLVEGEDDQMVWQYAVRHSTKKLNFHLVEAGSKDKLTEYENLVNQIALQLFDHPIAYEIRDRDYDANGVLGPETIDDKGVVKRAKLRCKEIENLILSNEVLAELGYANWESAQSRLVGTDFEGIDRYSVDLESGIYKLLKLLKDDNSKSWEVLVGRSIGKRLTNITELKAVNGSIFHMLGEKISSWMEQIPSRS